RHGGGEIEAYILEGIARGLEILAITEHVPLPGDPDPFRLRCAEFEAFNDELDRMIARYAGQIRVLKGFECEYYPKLLERYKRFREEYGYRVLLLGHHTDCANTVDNFLLTEPSQLRNYADEVCEGLETGLFDILAHPDVVMAGYGRYDTALCEAMKQIFAACERLDIPVEINANGHHYRRGYPCPMVWENLAPRYKL
ncbi:MAG TPA: PHP domain-containing protein, partial [Clostridia bacterium]|nr:PHP domain-containing protein [Clostridia bacterium]